MAVKAAEDIPLPLQQSWTQRQKVAVLRLFLESVVEVSAPVPSQPIVSYLLEEPFRRIRHLADSPVARQWPAILSHWKWG